ncbi:hypothetical protein NA56DRAFT_212853 [Hyaloscypha hepaticicola]|uniref:Uncharacterized protein n=1 Tax=Hyaloscypha hepaticicola TaxID=2082293 RepID=A0A2J6PYA9_9HELO|nr:hypothetical protein NA56DRAFT_212853 [Hyaloscypha hepaticicola]
MNYEMVPSPGTSMVVKMGAGKARRLDCSTEILCRFISCSAHISGWMRKGVTGDGLDGWMAFLGGLLGAMFRAGCRQAPQLGRMVPWRSDSSNLRGVIRSYRTQPWFVPVKTSVDCVVRGAIYVIARCRRSKRPIFAIERECHHTRCYQLYHRLINNRIYRTTVGALESETKSVANAG